MYFAWIGKLLSNGESCPAVTDDPIKLITKSFFIPIEVDTSSIRCSNLSFNTSNDVFVMAADCKKFGYLSISHLLNKLSNIPYNNIYQTIKDVKINMFIDLE